MLQRQVKNQSLANAVLTAVLKLIRGFFILLNYTYVKAEKRYIAEGLADRSGKPTV